MTDRQTKKAKKMGLGLISAGFIFFFFPDFTVLDLLPDIIGYILISAGLTRLSDMYDEFADTKKAFHRLILFGAVKIFGVFIVYLFSDGSEQPTTILTTVFVLAAAECLLLIPAYLKFFDALVHAATRLDGIAIFEGPKGKTGYADKIKTFTLSFVVIKNLLWFLPETQALAVTDNFQSYNYSSYDFINHFRLIGMIIILVVGIIWLVKIRKYISSIIKDEPFMERLLDKYKNEILPDSSILARRKLGLALSMLALGAILSVDFYIGGNEGFNVIPDTLSGICFLFGCVMLTHKTSRIKLPAVVLSVLYSAISAVSYWFSCDFSQKYHPFDVSRKPSAFQSWNILFALSVIEAILFLSTVIVICLLLYECVKKNTGYTPIHATVDPFARAAEFHGAIRNMLIASCVFAFLSAIGTGFRVYAFSVYSVAEASWLIEFAVTAIFAGVFMFMLHKIKEKSEEKYLFS